MSAAVDSTTSAMAATTVNDPATTDTAVAVTSGDNDAATNSAAEGRRLYIGNLAYATTEGELRDFFKDYLVETVSIPTNPRTTRPVGYAFVDLSTPSEADRAVNDLNGKSVLDRKVSVQLARKHEPAAEDEAEGTETRRRSSTRGRGRGRGRGGRFARGRGRRSNGENGTDGPTNVPGQVSGLTETTNEAEKGAPGTTTVKNGRTPPLRERKPRGPPEDGVPSKTKVMVANLPYDLGEDKLLALFADYGALHAKIALRPIPRFMIKKLEARNEPRKGRGFGFVTLPDEATQLKACAEMNGKEIDGREIAVKVAIDTPGKEDAEIIEGEGEDPNGLPSNAEASATVAEA